MLRWCQGVFVEVQAQKLSPIYPAPGRRICRHPFDIWFNLDHPGSFLKASHGNEDSRGKMRFVKRPFPEPPSPKTFNILARYRCGLVS